MPTLIDFVPLRSEDVETVQGRMHADANAGLEPSDERFIDTTEGGFFWDATRPAAIEIARLWDFAATELLAQAFPSSAAGIYLDYHGETLGLDRKDAVQAAGEVTFTGTNGIEITAGTRVATLAVSVDSEGAEFEVTMGGTITGGTVTLPVQAVEPGEAGNVTANTIGELLTPLSDVSVTNAAAITGGFEVEDDEAYRDRLEAAFVEAQGGGTLADYKKWAVDYPGVGHAEVTPHDPAPGYVRVVVTDENNDPVSATVLAGLQARVDPFDATTTSTGSQTLPAATVNVASTTGFDDSGAVLIGNDPDLVLYTGKTGTALTGASGGSGAVAAGTAVRQGGAAGGEAPVGTTAYFQTPTALTVNVSATLRLLDGYTLDGAGGTLSVEGDVEEAVGAYVNALPPGGNVIRNKVIAAIVSAEGVDDVTALTPGADTVVAPLQVPQLGTLTLT